MSQTAAHLAAFSTLLAADIDTRALHMRHLQILALLCNHDHALAVKDIARLIDLSPSATSRSVDRLVEQGFLHRSDAIEDRRNTVVAPTKSGRALDARVMQLFAGAASVDQIPASSQRTPQL